MTTSEKLVKVAENRERIYEKGKQAERNAFWDGVFSGVNWQQKFTGSTWNDNTFYPNQDIKPIGHANSLFYLVEITDLVGRLKECGVKLDTSGVTQRSDYMFNYCTKLTTVPYLDLRNANGYDYSLMGNMFSNCYALKTIEGIHLSDDGLQNLGAPYSCFNQCTALENVTFYGKIGTSLYFNQSSMLSRTSIENVVSSLSDTATGQTISFSNTAKTAAFTDEEWAALIATKPNWTFTLV